MVEEQKPASTEELKKELADIKRDMMRSELEEIKREKMREELEELKAEQAAGVKRQAYVRYSPKLSIPTLIMAALALLLAGYVLGTLYWLDMASEVDNFLLSYGLPAIGPIVLTVVAVVLALIGMGLATMARK